MKWDYIPRRCLCSKYIHQIKVSRNNFSYKGLHFQPSSWFQTFQRCSHQILQVMKLQTIFQRRWKFPEPFTQRNIYIWNLLPTESSETWHGLYTVGGGWGTHIAGWNHAVLCRQPYIKALVSPFQLDKLTIKEMHPHISQCVLRE